jgi:hypothetical protein
MAYALVLIVHVCAAAIGLLSGAAAVVFRKGSRRHGLTGDVFVVSVLAMGVSAACLGLMIGDPGDVGGGVMTCYFVATGWATARRRNGGTSVFDWLGLLVISAFAAMTLTKAFQVLNGQARLEDGVPVAIPFFLGSLCILAAAGDLRMLVRGGIFGDRRTARHLWRMCFGFFIATGSFFLARAHIFPSFIRKTYILPLLGFFPLILLVFWLCRILVANVWRRSKARSASPAAAPAEPLPVPSGQVAAASIHD